MEENTETPKRVKKKKYLYLDRFMDYALVVDSRIARLEKCNIITSIIIIALSITLAIVAIHK